MRNRRDLHDAEDRVEIGQPVLEKILTAAQYSINRRVTVNFRSPMFYVKSVDNGYRTTIIFWITGGPISTRSSATCRPCLLFEVLQISNFGLQGIFVRDRIFVIIIIQFGGSLFRYYLVFVRQILIVFVIVIVN